MRIALAALLVASACGGQQGTRPVATEPPSMPTPRASAAPSPAPPRGSPPVSTGVAPEAGVLFVTGAGDWIYRYDGATGGLPRVTRHPRIGLVTRDGAYAEGLEGGLALLHWD